MGDDPDFVKVLDFGVAKLKAEDKRMGTLTQAGMVFGTPKYMSPEQSRSDITDARADVYALGVILYEMVTGRAPFEADNPLSILIQHVQDVVPPPSTVRPDLVIPASVESIILRCLEKDADARYQTARGLAEALEEAERELDEAFERVLTRSDAEGLGLEVPSAGGRVALSRPSRRSARVRPDPARTTRRPPMSAEEARPLLEAMRRRKRWRRVFVGAAALLVAVGAALVAVSLNLPGTPPGFSRLFPERAALLSELSPLPIDTVTVTLRSRPTGATVYRGDTPLGRTPLRLERTPPARQRSAPCTARGLRLRHARRELRQGRRVRRRLGGAEARGRDRDEGSAGPAEAQSPGEAEPARALGSRRNRRRSWAARWTISSRFASGDSGRELAQFPGRGGYRPMPKGPLDHASYDISPVDRYRRVSIAVFAVLGLIVLSTLVYYHLGDGAWSLLDCLYMTLVTLTTVGFEDVLGVDKIPEAKIFTIGLLVAGIALVAMLLSTVTAFVVEGDFRQILGRKRMKRRIDKLTNHIIVLGVGRTGRHTALQLARNDFEVLLVDIDEDAIGAFLEDCDFDLPYIVGDGSQENVLEAAGIDRAGGIVCAMESDQSNLYAVLTARGLNPHIRIVSRANELSAVSKLKAVGAHGAVAPAELGGVRLFSEMVRPEATAFLETLLSDRGHGVTLQVVTVQPGSDVAGLSLAGANLRERVGPVIVMAYRGPDEDDFKAVIPSQIMVPGATMLVMGESSQIAGMKALLHGAGAVAS